MYVLANPNYVDTALPVSVLGLICPTLFLSRIPHSHVPHCVCKRPMFSSCHGCFLYWIHARFRCFLRLGLQKRPPRVRIKLHVPVNSFFLVLCVTSNVCPSAVVLVLQLFVLVVLSVVFPYFFLVLVALCCFPCCFLSALSSHSTQSPLLVQLRQQAPPCALLDTSQLYLKICTAITCLC
jgi:hypothetical protein